MKKSFTGTAVLALAVLSSFVSCQKSPRRGDPVVFSAAISKDLETKTVYGSMNGSGNHQDIFWAAGDQICIYSSDGTVAQTEAGDTYATYSLNIDNSDMTTARPTNSGLLWENTGEVTFYGVYPHTTASSALGVFDMEIPADQSATQTESSLSLGYMVAKTAFSSGSSNVVLQFFPAFTAFEIHLGNKDATELTLKRFAIKTDDPSYSLAAQYSTDWTSTDATYTVTSSLDHQVYVDFPAGTVISDTQEADITLFLPPVTLSNLYLEVSFELPSGESRLRKLPLKQNDAYLSFAPCRKHVINGLAMDAADIWMLEVNGSVLPWNGVENTIMEEVSIYGKVAITGAIETTNAWMTSSVGNAASDHFADSAWEEGGTTGFELNYQLRTLNKDLPAAQRYFTMTFTPTAPTGGYWQLIPQYREGDTQSPRHFRFERDLPGGGISDQLSGQILNQKETIRIYPVDWDPSDVNTYDVWFTSRFSTSPTFAHSINADSEFQDVHKDGRFSYWVLHIAQYNGVFLDE